MNVYTMVVIIVVVTTFGGVAQRWLKLRERERKSGIGSDTEARLEKIEQRLQVLEQIVTDPRQELNRAFEDIEAGAEDSGEK